MGTVPLSQLVKCLFFRFSTRMLLLASLVVENGEIACPTSWDTGTVPVSHACLTSPEGGVHADSGTGWRRDHAQ